MVMWKPVIAKELRSVIRFVGNNNLVPLGRNRFGQHKKLDPSGEVRRPACIYQRFVFLLHSRPQRPRFFWSAPRIATSGKVRFSEHAQSNRFVFSANQIVRLNSDAQSGGKSVNRGLPEVSILGVTKRSAVSRNENVFTHS